MLEELLQKNIRTHFKWAADEELQCYQFVKSHIRTFPTIMDAYAYARILYKEGIFADSNLVVERFRHGELVFFKSIRLKSLAALDKHPKDITFKYYLYSVLGFPYKCHILNEYDLKNSDSSYLPLGIQLHDTLAEPKWIDRFEGFPDWAPRSLTIQLSLPQELQEWDSQRWERLWAPRSPELL